ncbi:MAG: T9SS type A sorting domain-containing protein [Flavobacteriales bacterium]|nr:T9SS type A sorting domain-containing protein [Flavobacteriales bacterium]
MRIFIVTISLITNYFFAQGQLISNGLIGYWPFNGNANDESSNSNNGTVYNATLTTDRFGDTSSAYYFDGNGDYIDCGNNSSLFVSTNTTNFWFKYNSDTTKIQVMVNDANSNSGEWGAAYKFEPNGGIQAGLSGGANDAWLSARTNKSYADNKWHMFTSTYSAIDNSFNVYIDGCFVTAKTHQRYGFTNGKDSLQHNGTDHWIFGAHSQYFSSTINAGPRYYQGSLDDIMLFNRVLTPIEVMKLYMGEVCIRTDTNYVTINDTTFYHFYDTTHVYDTAHTMVYDTTHIQIFDTTYVTLYDTTHVIVFDTTYLTKFVYDTIQIKVYDTSYVIIPLYDTIKYTTYDTVVTYEKVYISVTDTLFINIDDPSGGGQKSCKIRIYPNPTNDFVFIDSKQGCSLNGYRIKIVNDIGQLIYQTSLNGSIQGVDISKFASNGFYVVEIISPQGISLERKIIILY